MDSLESVSDQMQNEPVVIDVTDLAAKEESVKQEGPDPFQDAAVLLVHEVLGSVMTDLPMEGPPSLEEPADLPPAEPTVPRSMSVGTQTGRYFSTLTPILLGGSRVWLRANAFIMARLNCHPSGGRLLCCLQLCAANEPREYSSQGQG